MIDVSTDASDWIVRESATPHAKMSPTLKGPKISRRLRENIYPENSCKLCASDGWGESATAPGRYTMVP